MNTKIKKWGNSLALRIPKSYAKAANLNEDSEVKLKLEDNKIVVLKKKKTTYNLKDLLAGISKENIHEEVDFGKPEGKELI